MMASDNQDKHQPTFVFQWAQRVRPEKIRRLYETEAQGMLDEELLDEVFYAIYDRCQSILTCTEAAGGRVKCPQCSTVIERKDLSNRLESKAEVLLCPQCSWKTTWGEFLKSYQGKQLFAGGTGPAIQSYVNNFPRARTSREKILLIDTLIHAYHWEALNNPTRPTAVNLIAGNSQVIIDLLLGLAYGENDEEMQKTKFAWMKKTRDADERIWKGNLLRKPKDASTPP